MKKPELGQYYTPEAISDSIHRIVTGLIDSQPSNIADLAAGDGSLLKPFEEKWDSCQIHAFDIDPENIFTIENQFKEWNSSCTDSLTLRNEFTNFFDVMVGNPPFVKTKTTETSIHLFNNAFNYNEIKLGKTIRAEIQFLAQYLESTRHGGVISIIVPESIISNEQNTFVRQALLNKIKKLSVFEIQGQYFDKAEVRTYLISGIKTDTPDDKVTIGKIGAQGEIQKALVVDKKNCIERLDYKYLTHLSYFNELRSKHIVIGDITQVITRGVKTRTQLEKESQAYFHTTSFKEIDCNMAKLQGSSELMKQYRESLIARKGDVLIPRVGRKIAQSQAIVSSGNAILTDSVLRINASKKYSAYIFETLNSEFGQNYREALAKGSCTKLLTIKDILKMPIIGLSD